MLIKKITLYLQGSLSEDEALKLWEYFLLQPEDIEILEFYKMLREYFK